ncbi:MULTISPECIES: DUF3581 domain-containing protein [Vibrio]|uniref:DUF3581 family protein n=1 Tax=Vibrio algicola TaxID=2662262 RepID=A0A5Q0TCZ4_9VIBR|nr:MULTISPECIES: DUF3581 domain-containing protein [Vibrio]MBD1575692.1 DUF3581 family protein [Vibrio sp. S11_S32]
MFLKPYVSTEGNTFEFTRDQASKFAKRVAGDFNPIHDEDSKRFCIPGDLLFAVLLQKKGISEKMSFRFSGMVADGVPLHIEETTANEIALLDDKGKEYLHMHHEGKVCNNDVFIEHVVTNYVQFSGRNFPHIMVPLMEEQQQMFNCKRPLVIYESMDIEFSRLDLTHPEVEFSGASFDVSGKRGIVTLNFAFKEQGEVVGRGVKRMIASGLKPFCSEELNYFVDIFNKRKEAYLAAQ